MPIGKDDNPFEAFFDKKATLPEVQQWLNDSRKETGQEPLDLKQTLHVIEMSVMISRSTFTDKSGKILTNDDEIINEAKQSGYVNGCYVKEGKTTNFKIKHL